jgi:uncharacterized protein YjbI with pentapeptide repeats
LGAKLPSMWKIIKQYRVATVLIALLAVVIVLIILSILGYIFNWEWTGLGPYISPPHSKNSDFQRGKTLWDWLQLLIIPAVLAVAGYVINLTISRGEQEATQQRDKTEREIAKDNQHEATLQAYIDKMSELMLEKKLRQSDLDAEVRKVARVQTLTVLFNLGAGEVEVNFLDRLRQRRVLKFLYEAELISKDQRIIDLSEAILSNAYLVGDNMSGVDLSGASLHKAGLVDTNLSEARLKNAFLSEAIMVAADLRGASLTGADLSFANLSAADLSDASLDDTDLSDANLNGSIVTLEQLKSAKSLSGATMPDGSIHP